jgi:predicted GH43/DUF377 family glycosyl hydrolase
MNAIKVHRHTPRFSPQSDRVILRPFIPGDSDSITAVINRAMAMTEDHVTLALDEVRHEFNTRHIDVESILLAHFEMIESYIPPTALMTPTRRHFIGALFSGEYALESAALFNPSIVPHPDQSYTNAGDLRFIMSLRATGEGHISSIEFRSGIIAASGKIIMDPISRFVTAPERSVSVLHSTSTRNDDANYTLRFSETLAMSERIIFPSSASESNGIEDARFVRFIDDDGVVTYYATYTAYNGRDIQPQLIETKDFHTFKMSTFIGNAVQNKGMALFPRRINGKYAMLSRQDGENLYILFSNTPHEWHNPTLLMQPAAVWESIKIGNCGSPIETPEGWLVLTHGVGPMRKYCIGAALLDLNDPTQVLGRLKTPLLAPKGNEREGYVPNVVYSCGSLIHGKNLVLPYAMSDTASAIATVAIDVLLAAILKEFTSEPR